MSTVLIASSNSRKKADLFIFGCFAKEGLSRDAAKLEPSFADALKRASVKGRFDAAHGQVFSSYSVHGQEAAEVTVIGLGAKKNYKKICFRKAAGKIVALAKAAKAKKVRVCLDTFAGGEVALGEVAGILSEMSEIATYAFDRYKASKKAAKPVFEGLVLRRGSLAPLQKKVDWNFAVAQGIMHARDMINEPGNVMNPQKLVAEARSLAKKKKLSCQVFGPADLKRMKMNGILAVNQGSVTPPALIVLEYGKAHKSKGTVCLVGKGVTFDTGGISIKPSKDMEKMKYDMSGASAVIATMGVLADLKVKRHVVALTPTVENMVAADPQRPGDIIRMYNGKTVEVLNTDAEGRLILADALAYSAKYKPKALIDMATLTGMVVYTFGDKAMGLMGNDEALIQKVQSAGEACGDRCWQLPLWDDYREQIKGHHSDLLNIGGPYGGTITAGMFLKEFVPEKTPWVHLDIAGMAWSNTGRYDCVKGATGVGVKLMAQLLAG